VEVGGIWGAGLVEADLVEVGPPVVVAGEYGEVLDDAGLVVRDPDVGGPPLAVQPDVDRLSGAEVAHPRKLGSDQQDSVVAA
jgi:hypothetical protein